MGFDGDNGMAPPFTVGAAGVAVAGFFATINAAIPALNSSRGFMLPLNQLDECARTAREIVKQGHHAEVVPEHGITE